MGRPVFGERMVSAVGIVDFPALFQPGDGKYDKGKFKVTLLYPKDDEKAIAFLKKLKAECSRIGKDAFGDKAIELPIKDGDKKGKEQYEGYYILTAKSKFKPDIVGPSNKRDLAEHDVYSGCLGRISCTPFTWEEAGKRGVSLFLGNFQKVGDGDKRGGGGMPADAEFGEMDVLGDSNAGIPRSDEEEIPF